MIRLNELARVRASERADAPGEGRGGELNALLEVALRDLRVIAAGALAHERPGHTLQPTALVNEFWLRLAARESGGGEGGSLSFQSYEHFLAYAARAIGHILVDHARARNAAKRGGGQESVSLDLEGQPEPPDRPTHEDEVLHIAELLARLEISNPRAGRVAQMRWYAGMGDLAIARVLGVSERTVRNDWRAARAWLAAELRDANHRAT